MLKLATIPGHHVSGPEVPWAQRYRRVATRQRELAEAATLPLVREQLLQSAEKWEYLARREDADPRAA